MLEITSPPLPSVRLPRRRLYAVDSSAEPAAEETNAGECCSAEPAQRNQTLGGQARNSTDKAQASSRGPCALSRSQRPCWQLEPPETATRARETGHPRGSALLVPRRTGISVGVSIRVACGAPERPGPAKLPPATGRPLGRTPPFSACTARTRTPVGGNRTSAVTRSRRRGRFRVLPAAARVTTAQSRPPWKQQQRNHSTELGIISSMQNLEMLGSDWSIRFSARASH